MTTTYAFDADGNPVDPDDPKAVTAEIHYDDGMREYVRMGEFPDLNFGDDDPVDTQITSGSTQWTLPDTLEDLIATLGGDRIGPDRLADRLAAVVLTPAWPNAPQTLQTQVYAILAG